MGYLRVFKQTTVTEKVKIRSKDCTLKNEVKFVDKKVQTTNRHYNTLWVEHERVDDLWKWAVFSTITNFLMLKI